MVQHHSNCIKLVLTVESNIISPSSTPWSILAKLSSVNIISAASFATAVPVIPIAAPISAFFDACESSIPPVIAIPPNFCTDVQEEIVDQVIRIENLGVASDDNNGNNNNNDDIAREEEKMDVLVTRRNGVTQGGREEGAVIASDMQTSNSRTPPNTNSNTNSTQHAVIVDLK